MRKPTIGRTTQVRFPSAKVYGEIKKIVEDERENPSGMVESSINDFLVNSAVTRLRKLKAEKNRKCVLCGRPAEPWPGGGGFGNNPQPLSQTGVCCNTCNDTKVLPARFENLRKGLDPRG